VWVTQMLTMFVVCIWGEMMSILVEADRGPKDGMGLVLVPIRGNEFIKS
jgi:hypothetical protein